MFQLSPGQPNTGIILVTLVLVLAALILFILLLARVCVTLASEDQICLMSHMGTAGEDTEDLDTVDNIEEDKELTDKNYLQRYFDQVM